MLRVRLFFPDTEIEQLHSVALTAAVDGTPIGHNVYTSAGLADFTALVPSSLLRTNLLPVQFCFDKAMAPTESDSRELSGIVTSISLSLASQP